MWRRSKPPGRVKRVFLRFSNPRSPPLFPPQIYYCGAYGVDACWIPSTDWVLAREDFVAKESEGIMEKWNKEREEGENVVRVVVSLTRRGRE